MVFKIEIKELTDFLGSPNIMMNIYIGRKEYIVSPARCKLDIEKININDHR